MTTLRFDRIVIARGTTRRVLSLDEFMDLPLHTRISHILGREVEFYSGGQLVDRTVALRVLRQATA